MSGWTTVEIHSLEGEFSRSGADYLEEKLQDITQDISYKTPKRIIGRLGGYGRYPDEDQVRKISKYKQVGIAVCQANDTSDTGETEFFIDGERVEHFNGDRLCYNAMSTLKSRYGIYLYASYYWDNIGCEITELSKNNVGVEDEGRLSIMRSHEQDIQINFERESTGTNRTTECHITSQDAINLLQALEESLE